MNAIASAVLSTGLLDSTLLAEMRRWGLQIEIPEPEQSPKTPEEVAARIQDALESEGYVLVRETDLTVLQQYAATAQQGILRLVLDDDQKVDDTTVEVTFGRTPLNDYILPWRSETIADVLANGMTHLVDGQVHVYFKEVRELFFGDTKAFMICQPSYIERIVTPPASVEEPPYESP